MTETTGRNIVILCDGTGNEISENISNVLKLYRCLRKTAKTQPRQFVYYDPGVGTLAQPSTWHKIRANISLVLGLATGYGLDPNVLAAYQFLVNHWQEGDRIYLFGFSRGAYTVRVLAGLIHKIGLIAPEQVNLAGSGQIAYKQFSTDAPAHGMDPSAITVDSDENGPLPAGRFDNAAQFARITSARWPVIDFVGVWDTVASVFVPRFDRWIFVMSMEELAFTSANPSVKVFRQAIAIDERRRMFRLQPWDDPQVFMSNPYAPNASQKPQDILQVWFAGVHGDVGASYPEAQCQVSKYPLLWMIDEACKEKLTVNPRTVNQLAWGRSRKNSPFQYVAPDYRGEVHNSMNFAWRLLEGMPKNDKYKEWPERQSRFGYYLPCEEPRFIPEGAVIHESVVERMEALPSYRPVNMPKHYTVFDMPTPPAEHEAAEV